MIWLTSVRWFPPVSPLLGRLKLSYRMIIISKINNNNNKILLVTSIRCSCLLKGNGSRGFSGIFTSSSPVNHRPAYKQATNKQTKNLHIMNILNILCKDVRVPLKAKMWKKIVLLCTQQSPKYRVEKTWRVWRKKNRCICISFNLIILRFLFSYVIKYLLVISYQHVLHK